MPIKIRIICVRLRPTVCVQGYIHMFVRHLAEWEDEHHSIQ